MPQASDRATMGPFHHNARETDLNLFKDSKPRTVPQASDRATMGPFHHNARETDLNLFKDSKPRTVAQPASRAEFAPFHHNARERQLNLFKDSKPYVAAQPGSRVGFHPAPTAEEPSTWRPAPETVSRIPGGRSDVSMPTDITQPYMPTTNVLPMASQLAVVTPHGVFEGQLPNPVRPEQAQKILFKTEEDPYSVLNTRLGTANRAMDTGTRYTQYMAPMDDIHAIEPRVQTRFPGMYDTL